MLLRVPALPTQVQEVANKAFDAAEDAARASMSAKCDLEELAVARGPKEGLEARAEPKAQGT